MSAVIRQILNTQLYPLDKITKPIAAYSLRRLYKSFNGSSIRVRRSSDNAEADIGFTRKNTLNTTQLLNFVGSGDGDVMVWSDQTNNGYHLIQEVPFRIVASGVLITENNNPAMRSNNTASMSVTTPVTSRSNFTFATVAKFYTQTIWSPICGIKTNTTTAGNGEPLLQQNGVSITSNALASHNTGVSDATGNLISITTSNFLAQRIAFLSRNGGDSLGNGATLRLKINDVFSAVLVTQSFNVGGLSSTFRIGGRQQTATAFFDGVIQEILLFSAALSINDELALMQNQGTYYGLSVI